MRRPDVTCNQHGMGKHVTGDENLVATISDCKAVTTTYAYTGEDVVHTARLHLGKLTRDHHNCSSACKERRNLHARSQPNGSEEQGLLRSRMTGRSAGGGHEA